MSYINQKVDIEFIESTVEITIPTLFNFTCPRCESFYEEFKGLYKGGYILKQDSIGVVTMFACLQCGLVMTVIGRDDDAILEAEWGDWKDDRGNWTNFRGAISGH